MNSKEQDTQWNNFVYNVIWLREHYGFTKKKMAALLEISVATLNKLEKGDLPPKLKMNIFFLIQHRFGIPPKDQLKKRLANWGKK